MARGEWGRGEERRGQLHACTCCAERRRLPARPGSNQALAHPRLYRQAETLRFNASFGRKDGATPLADFLVQAAGRAGAMYRQAWGELARQVSRQCEHRGRLMADVWVGYSGMLDRWAGPCMQGPR